MKKFAFAITIALITISLDSCKKNEPADQLKSATEATDLSTDATQLVEQTVQTPEEMTKEAQSKPLTTLAISEDMYNFGDIKKGESVEHVYEVTNTGNNPLIISSVKPGCGCTAPDYTKDPIMPGSKGKITLKFDSSNFDGQIHKQAEIYANIEKAPITISFTGNVIK